MTEQEIIDTSTTNDVVVKNKPNKPSSFSKQNRQKTIFIVVMLFIPIAHFLFKWVYINGSTLVMAFQDRDGVWSLDNFSEVWTMLVVERGESNLSYSIYNSIRTFFFVECIGVPLSLVVSYFLYKQIAGHKAFRILFYLPRIVSEIVIITVFKQFVSPLGPFTLFCENVGITLPAEGLLHTPGHATETIIFYCIWTGACGNLLFYSAMSRVPPELVEAGKLDGLQLMTELIYVILPLIWPTFSTTLVLDLTGILQSGGPVLLFGAQDVVSKANAGTIPYWFFSKVYSGGVSGIGSYGVMSCVGLIFTTISVPFTLIIRHLLGKVNTAEY